jgi:mannosyltransferase OCH1-like enzyme
VQEHFPEHLLAFQALPYAIQRADVIRYMWLYVYGGLYMDMDYLVKQSFAHLFEDKSSIYVLHSSHVPYILTNSLIGVLPKQAFLKTLISRALYTQKSVFYGKHLRVMFTTGPMAFHHTLTESKTPYTVLPTDLFLKDTPESYTIPLEGQSWNALDSLVFNTVLTYKKEVAIVLGLFVLYILRGFLQYRERVQVLKNLLLKKRK